MNRAHHLVLVAAAIMGLLAVAALLDGPSDHEFERAVQADLQDAIDHAGRDAPAVRLELARLEADRIEPAPAALLPRSARRLQSIASALTGYTAFLVVLISAGIGIALVLAPHIPQVAQP